MAENTLKALRDAYGEALVELGAEYNNLYVLDADLTKSTKTAGFAKAFPDRFINCGIAEGNMVSVAAGIASCGNIVFASTFAVFAAGRAFEQVRNSVGYPHLNVKIVGTHAGLTVGEDGATHQAIEDLALMRAIPGMLVLSPSDAVQTKAAVKFAAAYNGPVYIRVGRLPVPVVYDEADYTFNVSEAVKLAEGSFATIIFTGSFHTLSAEIAEIFAKNGLKMRILDMPTIKPIDTDAILAAQSETGGIITIEDHTIFGGLGSAVAEVMTSSAAVKRVPLIKIGVNDKFGRSGTPEAILEEYGYNASLIARRIAQEICPELCGMLDFTK